jgi:4-amino-4-deoxy-L-arabinose transferase-like glycosyltransferase
LNAVYTSRPLAGATNSLPAIVALAVLLAAFVFTAALRPLMLPDEGRYVGVAWEMVRSGEWLTPTLNGLPFFHKPPLFYWITAVSLQLFGDNEFAARAAPLVGATIGALALYLFTRRWSGKDQAWLALVALLAQPLFLCAGQYANLDILVAGIISATILLLVHVALAREAGQAERGALLAAYAMAALGVLAKGLIGAVIPALVLAAWMVLTRRWRLPLVLFSWAGLLIFLAIAAPWFIAMQLRYPAFADYFFVVQHFDRFSGGGFNNAQPFWFFGAVLLGVSVPWLPWLYRSVAVRPGTAAGDSLRLLMLSWAAVVLVFFSLPQSKLVGYILPAVPPLAWLIADGFMRARIASPRTQRVWWGAALFGMGLSVCAAIFFTISSRGSSRDLANAMEERREPGEPVVMLSHYYFDVPFYAHAREPVSVVDDWSNPDVNKRDNWRHEMSDGGRFEPVKARRVLIEGKDFIAQLCRAPITWVIGASDSPSAFPLLSGAHAVFSKQGTTLWRVEVRTLAAQLPPGCGGPSAVVSPDR